MTIEMIKHSVIRILLNKLCESWDVRNELKRMVGDRMQARWDCKALSEAILILIKIEPNKLPDIKQALFEEFKTDRFHYQKEEEVLIFYAIYKVKRIVNDILSHY